MWSVLEVVVLRRCLVFLFGLVMFFNVWKKMVLILLIFVCFCYWVICCENLMLVLFGLLSFKDGLSEFIVLSMKLWCLWYGSLVMLFVGME